MSSDRISLDIESLDGALAIADSVGGTLGVTTEGRLLIYGVPNAAEQAERINGKGPDPDRPSDGWWAFVEDDGDGYLAFDL